MRSTLHHTALWDLSTLSLEEIAHLASSGMTDARALMWVAACRKYRILAEFSLEVLDERLRTFQPEITTRNSSVS